MTNDRRILTQDDKDQIMAACKAAKKECDDCGHLFCSKPDKMQSSLEQINKIIAGELHDFEELNPKLTYVIEHIQRSIEYICNGVAESALEQYHDLYRKYKDVKLDFDRIMTNDIDSRRSFEIMHNMQTAYLDEQYENQKNRYLIETYEVEVKRLKERIEAQQMHIDRVINWYNKACSCPDKPKTFTALKRSINLKKRKEEGKW